MQYQDLDISMKRFRGGGRLKYSGLVRERAVESTKNNMDAAIWMRKWINYMHEKLFNFVFKSITWRLHVIRF